MIVVKLMGGLGNQLFQFSAARALSLNKKVPLSFFFEDHYKHTQRDYALSGFNIQAARVNKHEIKSYLPDRGFVRVIKKALGLNYQGKVYHEQKHFVFDPSFLDQPDETLLIGFWQSYKYLEPIRKTLLQELTLKNPLSKGAGVWESKIKGVPNAVAVHVRRGDYTNPKSGFSPLSINYYQHAIKYINDRFPDPEFFVFTDDPDWVRENFALLGPFTLVGGEHPDYEDLYLLSVCQHAIIANSSFSWWGAWLSTNSNKQILYPATWSNDASLDLSDLFPENWKKITYD